MTRLTRGKEGPDTGGLDSIDRELESFFPTYLPEASPKVPRT